MDLSNLRPAEGSVQSDNFRRGRGHGSGNGKTAGKGHKGQKARSGARDNDAIVTVDTLIEKGIVKNPRDGVKILGGGELTKKLTVQVNAFSESAKEKIEALGGKAEVI